MPRFTRQTLPVPVVESDGRLRVSMPGGLLLAMVGEYTSELTAYLRFEYLQGLKDVAGTEVLMRSVEQPDDRPVYRLYIVLPNDLLAGGTRVSRLQVAGFVPAAKLVWPARQEAEDWEQQTRLFDAAYHAPVRKRLLALPREELTSSVARFILFKVRTDRRVREQLTPVDTVPSHDDSLVFAADMIDVARFYDIPLSMLLGIGAMENNYLNVRGDLEHTSWKRHAQPGDLILKRGRGGRVLVSNFSEGPWQITRETLRKAHALFLEDKRDYTELPPRLRPPQTLQLNDVDVHVLTTYAGLLLRHLLDHFNGDVAKAEGAYNGGTVKPNLQYAEGVDTVAGYARRVVSLAIAGKAHAVQQTPISVTTDVAAAAPPRDPLPLAADRDATQ